MPGHPADHDQMRLPLQRDVPFGADQFVRSATNTEAFEVLEQWPGPTSRSLALCGPAGCGKSHLAALWAERVGALALTGTEAVRTDPLMLEGRPLLLDIAEDTNDETLFHLINLAQADGGALLMVSRTEPRHWQVDIPDLRSRLDAIRVVTLAPPDDAVLGAILKARFAERSIVPTDDVIDYLVLRIDRSAEAAQDIVAALDQAHAPVTRVLARKILESRDEPADLFE